MLRRIVCILMVALFCLPIRVLAESFSDSPTAIEQASESVVLLECYDKDGKLYCTGSAFAAFDDGVFVTNHHVAEGDVYRILAHSESGIMFEISHVLAYDIEKDIAILKTQAKTGISPLHCEDEKELHKGEKIVAIGSPLGFINTVSTGIVSGINSTKSFNEIMFTASISHGSSGGVLLNDDGNVIGITYGSYENGQNLNVAIPIGYASELFNNSCSPLTIAEHHDLLAPKVFTVDYVLSHRATMAGEEGILTGYIADIDGPRCNLVSNQENISKCKLAGTRIIGNSLSKSHSSSNYQTAEEWLSQNDHISYENRNSLSICLFNLSAKGNPFAGLHVGDEVQISVKFLPKNNSEFYTIYISNADVISVL